MLFLSQSQLQKLSEKGGNKALSVAYVYCVTNDSDILYGQQNQFESLVPPKDAMEAVVKGELDQKEFLKQYKKSLQTYENEFLLYTIARSFNEKKFMPIFVCSDTEYELGYMKVLKKYLQKKFGMQPISLKKYLKAVKVVSKEVKSIKKKGKRRKAFAKGMREFIKEVCQIKLKGLEKLEKADRKFAIDRIALYINQSETAEEIGKGAIIKSIKAFAETKKGRKLVKKHIKALDLSKHSDRWSKKEAIGLVISIYNDIHQVDADSDEN